MSLMTLPHVVPSPQDLRSSSEKQFKGVVHFKKKTFADNLLTPMSTKISMSFFLQLKRNQGF